MRQGEQQASTTSALTLSARFPMQVVVAILHILSQLAQHWSINVKVFVNCVQETDVRPGTILKMVPPLHQARGPLLRQSSALSKRRQRLYFYFYFFTFSAGAGAMAAAGVSCIDAELCFVEAETARARARLVTGHLGSRTHRAGHCHWPVALRQREYSGDTRCIEPQIIEP